MMAAGYHYFIYTGRLKMYYYVPPEHKTVEYVALPELALYVLGAVVSLLLVPWGWRQVERWARSAPTRPLLAALA